MATILRTAAVLLVAVCAMAGCGEDAAKEDGKSTEVKQVESVIQTAIEEDGGIKPGLTLDGLVVAVADSSVSYFDFDGVEADQVEISGVDIDEGGKKAEAEVAFGVKDSEADCEGAALAEKVDGEWKLQLLTVSVCA